MSLSNIPHPSLNVNVRPGLTRAQILEYITGGYYINKDHLIVSPHVQVELVEPEASTQAIIDPHLAILHSNAGPARTPWQNLITYWRRKDITGEAHFQIGTTRTAQAIPLNRKADCNYKANGFWKDGRFYGAISFETEDNGYPTLDTTPWTLTQLRDMIGILTCICVVYGMWCTAPAAWNDTGIGHHVLFKEWSSYTGKTCPGAARIRQMDYIRQAVADKLAQYGANTGWKCGGSYT